MTPEHPVTDDQLKSAIDRLARSEDGRTLYLFLQRRLMAISSAETDGALRVDQGERRFAAQLMALMSKGIAESGGRTDNQPVVFAVAGPRNVRDQRGAGRRVDTNTVVAGWNDSLDQQPNAIGS